jgi:hypothetical protein
MSSYKKYVMMGVTTILLPLGKLVFNKMKGKFTEESEQDFAAEENEAFAPTNRPSDRKLTWEI